MIDFVMLFIPVTHCYLYILMYINCLYDCSLNGLEVGKSPSAVCNINLGDCPDFGINTCKSMTEDCHLVL